jgi:hypothetical protein
MTAKRWLLAGAAALLTLTLAAPLAVASSKPSTTTLHFGVRFQDELLDLGAPGSSGATRSSCTTCWSTTAAARSATTAVCAR